MYGYWMYRRILSPVDGSKPAAETLTQVVKLCRWVGAELVLVTIMDGRQLRAQGFDLPDELAQSAGGARRVIALHSKLEARVNAAAQAVKRAGVTVTTVVRHGDAAEQIVAATTDLECDLVAMAPQAHWGVREQLLGSVTEQVLHRSPVPVAIVRPGGAAFFAETKGAARAAGSIVVPLDGSESTEAALPAARALADAFQRRLQLVLILRPPPDDAVAAERLEAAIMQRDAERYLSGLMEELRSDGLEAYSEVIAGDPVAELASRATLSGATALVLSARRRSPKSARLFGGVIGPLIRRTHGTLLIVPR